MNAPTLLSQSITFRAETAFNHHRFKSKIMTAECLITRAALCARARGNDIHPRCINKCAMFPLVGNRDFSGKNGLLNVSINRSGRCYFQA